MYQRYSDCLYKQNCVCCKTLQYKLCWIQDNNIGTTAELVTDGFPM